MSVSEAVVKILGVEAISTPQVLNAIVREGLPPSAADRIAEYYGLSREQLSDLLGISIRTLERHRKDNKPFSLVQSDRLLRYAPIRFG
jgi:putative toxin-antitoxin system antitoxin component (TIGR02293 family)